MKALCQITDSDICIQCGLVLPAGARRTCKAWLAARPPSAAPLPPRPVLTGKRCCGQQPTTIRIVPPPK